MKLYNQFKTICTIMAIVVMFSSCSKQGDPGPAGVAGKDGINGTNGTNGVDGKDGKDGTNGTNGTNGTDGTNGKDGKDGTDGKDGNANVVGSDPFSTNSGTWTAGGNGAYYTASFTANLITQDIAEKGAVLCYQKLTNGAWLPLPSGYWTYYFTQGTIELFYGDATNPGAQTFRIVAISPSQLAAHPDLDLKNYNEVAKVLHISE